MGNPNTQPTAAQEAKKLADENAKKLAAFEKSKKIAILKKTKDNYVPAPETEDSYHARIEKKAFRADDGERMSKPQVQIFSERAFANFEENSANLGYSVDLLHDPTGKFKMCGVDKAKAEAKKAKKK